MRRATAFFLSSCSHASSKSPRMQATGSQCAIFPSPAQRFDLFVLATDVVSRRFSEVVITSLLKCAPRKVHHDWFIPCTECEGASWRRDGKVNVADTDELRLVLCFISVFACSSWPASSHAVCLINGTPCRF